MITFIIPGKQKQIINENEVLCIVADRRGCDFYVITNLLKKEYVRITSSHNLGYYKKQLGNSKLFEVHKKYIVNLEQVKSFDHKYCLELKIYIGIIVKVAKRKVAAFKKKLHSAL